LHKRVKIRLDARVPQAANPLKFDQSRGDPSGRGRSVFQSGGILFWQGSHHSEQVESKARYVNFFLQVAKGRELYILDELNLGGQRKSYGDI
jgi:hypothetical protein